MNWQRIRCLFFRELRDQLRDRRTMFTIFCLPLMLYPLMGLLMMQMAQLRTPRELNVLIIGDKPLDDDIEKFLADESTAPGRSSTNSDAEEPEKWALTGKNSAKPTFEFTDARGNRVQWRYATKESVQVAAEKVRSQLRNLEGSSSDTLTASVDATSALNDPLVGREFLQQLQADVLLVPAQSEIDNEVKLFANLALEGSQIAYSQVSGILQRWRDRQLADALITAGVEKDLIQALPIETVDVSEVSTKQTVLWAKILPLIMFVWALTGAFYPAIDLCAGEKERGTLETLLSGPASRSEIVFGKLFAVISFSVMTAFLNLMSMQVTISVVARQFAGSAAFDSISMGPLPWNAIGWLLVMLLPISILFSAVAMAIAALARSSKEGQYYLMPLLIIGMPLVILPMMPGIRLSIGTSLFPVAGAILLARTLVEGQYAQAVLFAPMVVLVTGISCWLATRWAVRQFESESVLFRETDRFDMSAWLQHLWRDRHEVATPTMSGICAAIILIGLFYVRLQTSTSEITWSYIAKSTIATQLAIILAPCLIMAVFLTTSIRKALRVKRVNLMALPAALLLALAMHPTYVQLSQWIQQEFPFSDDTKAALLGVDSLLAGAPFIGLILTLAVIPAICEELAFRGFIFAGFQTDRGNVRAIVLTSLLFGLSHGVLQQSISATLMGFILGLIAWRTGSVVCCILIHVCHNTLSMSFVRLTSVWEYPPSILQPFIEKTGDGFQYTGNWQAISGVLAVSLLFYFLRDHGEKIAAQESSVAPGRLFREAVPAEPAQ